MIDLHCHSTASDGAVPPEELPALALSCHVQALALTDHDTTDGLGRFLQASEEAGLHGIPGIELSTSLEGCSRYHIVGLFLRNWSSDSRLQEALAQIRVWRQERNLAILDKLQGLGRPVSLEEALSCGAENCVLGRPHIAAAMVKKGYCDSAQAAFNHWLRRGRPAHVSRQVLPVSEAIQCLHSCGGVAIWAHPCGSHSMTKPCLGRVLDQMQEAGLDGVEAYYPEHTWTETNSLLEMAGKRKLLISGGCDYHGGKASQGICIGRGHGGSFQVPDALLLPILERVHLRDGAGF